jgi:hypothetical protein
MQRKRAMHEDSINRAAALSLAEAGIVRLLICLRLLA